MFVYKCVRVKFIYLDILGYPMKIMLSLPQKMFERLKYEMKLRHLDSVQETIRQILSEYFKEEVVEV